MQDNFLKHQLSQFGLNPGDWSLVKQAGNRYQIKAVHDQSFTFQGTTKIKKGKIGWQKLELVSL